MQPTDLALPFLSQLLILIPNRLKKIYPPKRFSIKIIKTYLIYCK